MKNLIYIAALMFLASCGGKKDKKAELADLKKQQGELNQKIAKLQAEVGGTDSAKTMDVTVFDVQPGQFNNYVEIQGRIDAQENVTAFSQAPGTITAIYVKPGQHVSKGQVLVQLDNVVLQQQIAQAEAQVQLSRTLYQRQKNLWDQKIGTEVQFLQAQTTLQANEKALAGLKRQADQYRIKSPINGSIDQMDLKLGQAISPGQQGSGIQIVNDEILKVKANVPESYSASVSTGNNVKIVFPDVKDSLTTKVTFAAKAIDPTSRSFPIEVKLPERKSLRPNMTAVLKISDYNKANALAIPIKAIQKSENGDYVFVNVNGVARQKTIKQGAVSGGRAEILSGLNAGDKIVVEGAADIEDGDKVKVLQGVN
ncbi:efflux RND transporter periplasmic adaptor subunit [Mucilaginibacter sp. UR6-1]|uniref:efflux RND transporter periplasmic adaptor subunit n=1 Tax=Mucilaginibacter sp. UR6-1 TaxID=1435643 RepID=UPI001E5305F9|nr:efflux RND transporter periplasmic adaptor subunit [Mucilaginibacter sp. UR6-1]MCC8408106.1 efflux RND transporter periplasmic adaptor subunit [Mucilaginibacter sp. UR6-1]